jgi:hypothetical protein
MPIGTLSKTGERDKTRQATEMTTKPTDNHFNHEESGKMRQKCHAT